MTREEHISNLETIGCDGWTVTTEAYKSLQFAIEALEQEPCEDAISRQAVLDGLASIAKAKVKSDAQKSLMGRVMFFTEHLPSVKPQEPKWIPVSERLPIAGEYVGDVAKYYLVQNEYGDMLVARYTHSEYWEQIYQMKPIADEIVAWMPLPEPYKAGSEG